MVTIFGYMLIFYRAEKHLSILHHDKLVEVLIPAGADVNLADKVSI